MLAHFSYASDLALRFPTLCSLVMFVRGVDTSADVVGTTEQHLQQARAQLLQCESESQLLPVQEWRAAYRATGTDPTKFRMAAESILRRLRTSGEFAHTLHPLVLVCNALSARFAIPVAALDAERITGALQVGFADGQAVYQAFDGSRAPLPAGEVTFTDAAGEAHARKWSHKQSGLSAVSPATTQSFIVAEGLHASAPQDLAELQLLLTQALRTHWPRAQLDSHLLAGPRLTTGVDAPFTAAMA